jgi:hypothetical protein
LRAASSLHIFQPLEKSSERVNPRDLPGGKNAPGTLSRVAIKSAE